MFTLFYQGITYDTGGTDIKAGGIMAGMHRDKCGAAAVAGFFQVKTPLKLSYKVNNYICVLTIFLDGNDLRMLLIQE